MRDQVTIGWNVQIEAAISSDLKCWAVYLRHNMCESSIGALQNRGVSYIRGLDGIVKRRLMMDVTIYGYLEVVRCS